MAAMLSPIHISRCRGYFKRVNVHVQGLLAAAVTESAAPSGAINKDAAHGLCSSAKEMRAILPGLLFGADQP